MKGIKKVFDKFRFTVILTCCENVEYIEKSISSILNQKINFRSNVELIILNNWDNVKIHKMIDSFEGMFPNNISIIEDFEKSYLQLYNESLGMVRGKYVTFLDSHDYLSNNALSSVYSLFEKKDVDIVRIAKKYTSPVLKEYNETFTNNEVVNLLVNPERIIDSFKALFIRNEAISQEFNVDLLTSSQMDFLAAILLNKNNYAIDNVPKYYINQKYMKIPEDIDKVEYYAPRLTNFHNKLIDTTRKKYRYTPSYIQNMILNDLVNLIRYNDLTSLNEVQLDEFWKIFTNILQSISSNIIKSSNYIAEVKSFLMYIKNDKKMFINKSEDNVQLLINNHVLYTFKDIKLMLNYVYLEENILHIEGSFKTIFNPENIILNVISSQKDNRIILNSQDDFKLQTHNFSYLNIPWYHIVEFQINIPLNGTKNSSNEFELIFKDDSSSVKITPKVGYELTSNLYNVYSYKSKNLNYIVYEEDSNIITHEYKKKLKRTPLFSVIMAVYNSGKYLKESIDSVINQTLDFERYVQLILVDDGSTDNSVEIINEYRKKYPNNIVLLSKTHGGVSSARNLGLAHAIGRYINFLDSDDYLSKNALQQIKELFKKNKKIDIISIPIKYFDMMEFNHDLRYKFKGNRVIDLNNHPNYPQMSVSSTFIKRSIIRDISFNTDLICNEDTLFINQLLLRTRKYMTTDSATYFYRKRSGGDSITDLAVDKKEYFTDRLNNFHMALIKQCCENYGEVPDFIQYMLSYDLKNLIQIEELDIFENDEEIAEFNGVLDEVLSYITNINAIKRNRNIKGHYRNYLLYLKNPMDYHLEIDEEDNLKLKLDTIQLDLFNKNKIGLDIIEIKHGHLTIDGYLNTCFSDEVIEINLVQESANNQIIHKSQIFTYPQKDRKTKMFLSTPWKYYHHFEFKLKQEDIINSKLTFQVKYDDGKIQKEYNPELGLRLPSGLSTTGIYMAKEDILVYFQGKSLNVLPKSFKSMLRLEVSVERKIFRDKKEGYISVFGIRMLYLILYPIMKNKKIWLFNDRPLLADDNAKHLFKYSIAQKDDVSKYYVLRKESDDFNTMKKISKNIVEFGSLKHKLLFLYAQKHISAFVNEEYRNPFYEPGVFDQRRSFSGLSTTQRYFLQHGPTLGNVTRSLKKYNTNLSLILCSSKLERDSFFQWEYNFSKDIIHILGMPRYDNLTSDTKKQIVFMPTWRGNLKSEAALFNSDFYKSLNDFINNDDLHTFLKEKDYKFVLKPHPELLKYLDDMQLNENIIVSLDDSYQDLFRDSSILITDYSSVAFDFAYLKKPVIYYQPNDDYPYEKGYFIFEEMGFGDVILKEKDTVDKIKNYINNGCIMEDKYIERVNTFFEYNDKNNSKRTYEWIYND